MTEKSVADHQTFVSLIRTALSDKDIGSRLRMILNQPPFHRKSLLHAMLADLKLQSAPADFIQAIACLLDDEVATKARKLLDES